MPTRIEWVRNPDGTKGETWNPVTGCTKVSPGCAHCYAERMAKRLAGRCGYPEAPHHFDVTLHPDRLDRPSQWKKPRMIFVCSMSDLFHPNVPFEFIGRVFRTMYNNSVHTFQVLTKRLGRMLEFFAHWDEINHKTCTLAAYPHFYSHVWLGVTAENQAAADERIPLLLDIPAAVRFVSCEPLLGPVNLTRWLTCPTCGGSGYVSDYRGGGEFCGCNADPHLDWVIVGGESGPRARPMYPGWARALRDQCQVTSTLFFFKQWGAFKPDVLKARYWLGAGWNPDSRKGGRLLDGREWNEFPAIGRR